MKIMISGEQPFQVLSDNFSISPSNEGYTLQISADGIEFSDLFAVAADTTRMVTDVANGSYYRLAGNTSDVTVNWNRSCGGGEGGGGEYVLPKATATKLGGVKIGSGISIDADGKISATGGGSSLPSVYYFDLNENYKADDAMVAEINAMYDRVLAGDRAFSVNLRFEWEYYGGLTPVKAVEEGDGERCVYFNFTLYSLYFEQINVGKVDDGYYIRIGVKDNGEGQMVAFREWNALRLPIYKGLPTASADTLGGVKIGSGISISDDGTISATGGGGSTALNLNDIKNNWSDEQRIALYNELVTKFTNGEYFNAIFKGDIAGEKRLMSNPCINYDDGYRSINFNFYCEYGGVKNYFVRINSNGGFEDMGI